MKPEEISKIKIGDKLVWHGEAVNTYEITCVSATGSCAGKCTHGPREGLLGYFSLVALADQRCSFQLAWTQARLDELALELLPGWPRVGGRSCIDPPDGRRFDGGLHKIGHNLAAWRGCVSGDAGDFNDEAEFRKCCQIALDLYNARNNPKPASKPVLLSWSFKCAAADVDVRRCLREASAEGINAVKITVGDESAVFVSCRVFVDWVEALGGPALHGHYVCEYGDPIATLNVPCASDCGYRDRPEGIWVRAFETTRAEAWLRNTPVALRARKPEPEPEPKIACKVEAL